MNRHASTCILIAAIVVGSLTSAAGPQLVDTMTPDRVEEAIRLAADEPAARKWLRSYVVQTRSGMGAGPLIGHFSTPFARVVLAALAARKDGKRLAIADLTPDILAPEVHILVVRQPAAYRQADASVESVTITSGKNPPDPAIQPIRAAAATSRDYILYGLGPETAALVASFPLTAIADGNGIRVIFSDVVRGSTALTNCKECTVPFSVASLR